MSRQNQTIVNEFHLLGFQIGSDLQILLFIIVLVVYILTILGNLVIIIVIGLNFRLHNPMNFFLSNLSFVGIFYTTVTIPKMLNDLLVEEKTISFRGCIAQCYFFFVLGATENYILSLMAFDRYLAICKPLRYTTIMHHTFCCQLAVGSWLSSVLGSVLPVFFLCRLSFCGPNHINHFFCDSYPLLNLSCTDTALLKTYFFSLTWIIIFSSLFFTIASYIQIILVILRIPTTSGRQKAFSTCGSHLSVVMIYYGSVIFMYVRLKGKGYNEYDKVISLFYVVVTPFLNPIIYSLRNKEMIDTLRKPFMHISTCRCVFS
ncbi:olfactory receptor 6N1-like [Ascaphus truei]|uniref:olfactory receptor 6N1-like n=1 Tax=Ascaphus truei TaxID=8439 RepID=UPI003F59C42C